MLESVVSSAYPGGRVLYLRHAQLDEQERCMVKERGAFSLNSLSEAVGYAASGICISTPMKVTWINTMRVKISWSFAVIRFS